MYPNYGYQLYQAERTKTRAEVIADEGRRGRAAAAVSRAGRELARTAGAAARSALNATAAQVARPQMHTKESDEFPGASLRR
jgi:hypothetical protein